MAKTAVVIYNLGGPDSLDAVRPFLFNLFNDPAILRLPKPARWLLANVISRRRAPVAREIYAKMGGASPILEQTLRQQDALQAALGDDDTKVFVAMRYWQPLAATCVADVAAYAPDHIILLPLYPQFSTTTTASFLRVWHDAAQTFGLKVPTTEICCYPTEAGFIGAVAAATATALDEATRHGRPQVLFSAHGLPLKIVAAGDPYQAQVEATAAALQAKLGRDDFDSVICYQSRVGPVEWLKPYTDQEIERAAQAGAPIVVVPVAFVSEHSETLVELDIEYAHLARDKGAACYVRVPTVQTAAPFIDGLRRLVDDARAHGPGVLPDGGLRLCPDGAVACPCSRDRGAG